MAQKRPMYIPEHSSFLQEKFINYIMRRGKKTVARGIFADTLKRIEEKTKTNPIKIFEKAIENAKPLMEVKPQRVGGGVYQVPREVKPGRQLILSFRWIIGAAKAKKGSNIALRLTDEIIDASNGTGSAIKKKEDTHKMADANRAFAHFAKYKK